MPTIDTGYKPRPHQAELHKAIDKHRFSIVVAHRRFGKTVAAVNHLIDDALRSKKERPRYAYIAPYRNQAKLIAWDYLQHFTRNIPKTEFNQAELRVDLINGARITLFGADNANALRGQYFDGVFFDEFSQIAPSVFSEIVRPALADRLGWAVFGGTPMGRNHFYDLMLLAADRPDWSVSIYKASDTKVILQSELDAALLEMGQDRYNQEFECSFDAAIVGSYYGDYIKKAEDDQRIGVVPFDGMLRVNTAWDLGMGDDTSIWFYQESPGGQIRLLDYYENHGVGLEHYVRVIQEKAQKGGWILGDHLLPHDVEVRELGSGRSRFDTLVGLGITPTICPRMSIEDGINAVRVLFPRLWFNVPATQRGLDAVRQYRREYDDKRQVFYEKPLHDWTSHASDSLRYLAIGLKQKMSNAPIRRNISRLA